jgi:hypothetical protein
VFFDPGETETARLLRRIGAAPVSMQAKDSRGNCSGGSIARPEHWLSRLRPCSHLPGRKTRFRLPARLCRVGLFTHRVPTKGFCESSLHHFLLSQTFLAQAWFKFLEARVTL